VAFGSDEKEGTRRLNELAREGWEYVGPLANGLVAFKRAVRPPSTPGDLVSTFDKDLEGWTASGGNLSHGSAGGNPGGFLQLDDQALDQMLAIAPKRFHGDRSAFLGGTISFDARNLNNRAPDNVDAPPFGHVVIAGPEGKASRTLGGNGQPPADGKWHTYSASLDPAKWDGDLVKALRHVTSITVCLEFHNGVAESAGFDNFALRLPAKK
jgi:hypothetical protein